jgi:type 1 fimbriae regulatory protein FimB
MRKTATLRLVSDTAPTRVFGSTPKKRKPEHRKFMTEAEVEKLAKTAGNHRDRTMIRAAFIHGLRANEVVSLTWGQVDLNKSLLSIFRSKHGRDATHPIPGSELRALRKLHREAQDTGKEAFVFLSRLGGPMTTRAFAQVVERAAKSAGISDAHPHSLRHAAGYKAALEGRSMRDIQHYLGHRRIESTEIYTEHAPTNFKGWFK